MVESPGLSDTTEVVGESWFMKVEAPELRQIYESTSEVQDAEQLHEEWDTGQLYENTSEVQDAEQCFEVWDTGQQYVSLMIENARTDNKLENRFAFLDGAQVP